MGDKPENNSQEPSPWDILQIDEASKENKYSQIAEDLFFKRDKKKLCRILNHQRTKKILRQRLNLRNHQLPMINFSLWLLNPIQMN